MKGRKAYGLICTTVGGMEYYAGLVWDGELEERVTGLPVIEVPGGPCARIKLENWKSKLDEIGALFAQMAEEHEVDPSRPAMEFYRGFAELHLLLPVKQAGG
jgi:DNA gyrase inhibitor GyrI